MVMMILGGAIVKCAKWGLLKIKKKFEIELYICQDSGAARRKYYNSSFEMMNYSGIVEIQKPCYTKNGTTGNWE